MSEPTKVLMFGTPVIIDQIDDAGVINAELQTAIEQRREIDKGLTRSNAGGWHSRHDFADWSGKAGRKLLIHAIDLARDHTESAGDGPLLEWAAEAWANVSGPGASNKQHVHGGAFWSGVYYVRVPESDSGRLLLHDPRMPSLRMYAPHLRFKGAGPEQVARIVPKNGTLVIFPSWLSHSVEPWQGEGERISIAFNIMVRAAAGAQPDRHEPTQVE